MAAAPQVALRFLLYGAASVIVNVQADSKEGGREESVRASLVGAAVPACATAAAPAVEPPQATEV
jgi:hypothetical protein